MFLWENPECKGSQGWGIRNSWLQRLDESCKGVLRNGRGTCLGVDKGTRPRVEPEEEAGLQLILLLPAAYQRNTKDVARGCCSCTSSTWMSSYGPLRLLHTNKPFRVEQITSFILRTTAFSVLNQCRGFPETCTSILRFRPSNSERLQWDIKCDFILNPSPRHNIMQKK